MENELVFLGEDGRPITNSLKVAELFDKEHKNVLRDVEGLGCSEKFSMLNFGHTPYVHPQNGQTYHYYSMTKDGFSFLVMSYTGEKAAQFKESYIDAFNEMERRLKNVQSDLNQTTMKDLSRMLLESETECERLSGELKLEKKNRTKGVTDNSVVSERMDRLERIVMLALEPLYQSKIEREYQPPIENKKKTEQKESASIRPSHRTSTNIQRISPGAMLIKDVCKILQEKNHICIKQSDIFNWLRREGYILASKGNFNAPSEEMIKKGLMVFSKSGTTSDGFQYITPYITLTGYDYFEELIIQKGGIL